MSSQRQPSTPPHLPARASGSGARVAGNNTAEPPASREVPTHAPSEEDPFVQALVGGSDGDGATVQQSTRELSPESLALLLDRLDGMVEDNDGREGRRGLWPLVSRRRNESGVVARPRRSGRGLRIWLTVASVLLLIGLALLVWPKAPRRVGHVEDREGGGAWSADVRRVDLPEAPEQAPSTPEQPKAPSSEPEGSEDDPEASVAQRARGTVEFVREQGPAQIYLRGKLVGRAPGTLSLREGRHDLLVRTPEGVSYYRRVHVRARERQQVTLPH